MHCGPSTPSPTQSRPGHRQHTRHLRLGQERRAALLYSRYLFAWRVPGKRDGGEDYRIVDLTDRRNPGLPEQDFWLIDETTVVHLNYRADGTQIKRWRDLALEGAVSLSVHRT
ncbi:DUF6879 family protein [Streptomyces bobili]|uniref:DUF6879 family protein n=1 Tax=Streptomyces bobili TaxID=67280 RepID=UPI0033B72493